ncbi:hypothetical protein TNIN_278161 [Trichonephila inaurata madagascariensis]|uniref:Uncharacterized protein n=1 Tax=Trichonephila inaurata madagascariensis TaxID=2747483 RepID=A0A8X6JPF7_9ARAC|nr:hypothetical protein TNIN_278161 [Trichonephila inaurata madagascariensis]
MPVVDLADASKTTLNFVVVLNLVEPRDEEDNMLPFSVVMFRTSSICPKVKYYSSIKSPILRINLRFLISECSNELNLRIADSLESPNLDGGEWW